MLDDEDNLAWWFRSDHHYINISHFRHKDQSHGKVAAEDVGEGDKGKGSIFLISDDHGDWRSDDA